MAVQITFSREANPNFHFPTFPHRVHGHQEPGFDQIAASAFGFFTLFARTTALEIAAFWSVVIRSAVRAAAARKL
jgi:hypothetical protein